METTEKLKQIKRSFRLYMNGVTAASMRQKGLQYKINWGVAQTDLRRMAAEIGKDAALARLLWTESGIRECRLLATLVMPAEEMTLGEAEEWALSPMQVEVMEAAVFNLFQYVDGAENLASTMLDSADTMPRIGAYNLICRLVKRGSVLGDHLYDSLFECAASDIKQPAGPLLHALLNCMQYIASLDTAEARRADSILVASGY